jgi:hypothetical protein
VICFGIWKSVRGNSDSVNSALSVCEYPAFFIPDFLDPIPHPPSPHRQVHWPSAMVAVRKHRHAASRSSVQFMFLQPRPCAGLNPQKTHVGRTPNSGYAVARVKIENYVRQLSFA